MDKMELKALGKINLGLDVLGRRENGYHDVRMVMQTVYLYDQIRMEKTKKPGIELLTNLFYLPVNENNLAYQAADLLMKEFHVKEGVKITYDQYITKVASRMGNVLEKVTIEEYPVIEQIKNVMKEQGALNAMMSGSGPTVFGLYETKEKARKAAAKIREKQLAKQVYVTGIHNARRK